jgi:putative membrane protein
MEPTYSSFSNDDLTLRDRLAVDRTVLANERTMLGYVRTAMAFLALGVSFLHFLQGIYAQIAGSVFMAVSLPLLAVGAVRYLQVRRDLDNVLTNGE